MTTAPFDLHRWTRDWTAACPATRLEPLRGVAVLLPDGAQVALFRLADDSIRGAKTSSTALRVRQRAGAGVIHSSAQ